MAKILLVEDDAGLCRMIRDWLALEHHNIDIANDGKDGLEKLQFYQYDVVVLDWDLPHIQGIDVLEQFRDQGGKTPVLMLTGKDTMNEKEEGFDAGADDYLTKPFHMKELSARVRALLRRPDNFIGDVLKAGEIVLDRPAYAVTVGGKELKLLPKEFDLLEFFMRHPNQVFSAEALLNRVWQSESDATIDALTTVIKRLRKKIDPEGGKQSLIRTVHGVGYKLEIE